MFVLNQNHFHVLPCRFFFVAVVVVVENDDDVQNDCRNCGCAHQLIGVQVSMDASKGNSWLSTEIFSDISAFYLPCHGYSQIYEKEKENALILSEAKKR